MKKTLISYLVTCMCIVFCGCSKIEFELAPNQVDVDYSAQDVVATVNTPIACYELYSIDGEHLSKSILDNTFVYLGSTEIEYKWIKVRYDSQKRTFTISLEENLTERDRTVTIIVYSTHAMSRYNPSYQHCSLKITQRKKTFLMFHGFSVGRNNAEQRQGPALLRVLRNSPRAMLPHGL